MDDIEDFGKAAPLAATRTWLEAGERTADDIQQVYSALAWRLKIEVNSPESALNEIREAMALLKESLPIVADPVDDEIAAGDSYVFDPSSLTPDVSPGPVIPQNERKALFDSLKQSVGTASGLNLAQKD